MVIDDKTYVLDVNNYVPIETEKKQIILGHTFNHDMRHFIGWQHRYNGYYKKTAAFTISEAGLIYKHFNPKFYSNYFKDYNLNRKTIVILIENDGWLIKDSENNQFLTWIGDIYKEPTEVVKKRWRGLEYWAPYTQQQMESATNLVGMLCDEFNIPASAISHNTKIDRKFENYGVLFKSNLEKYHTDLNPTWDFEVFKNKIENYERKH